MQPEMPADPVTPATHRFDVCVVGAGSGNAVLDGLAGLRVALIDNGERFGGSCLTAGVVPSSMLAHAADLARSPEAARRLGVELGTAVADWAAIRDQVFSVVDAAAEAGLRARQDDPEVTVFRETARFIGPGRLLVGDAEISAGQVVIAAGSRPSIPEFAGLDDPQVAARVHTSRTIMRLDALPASLVIIGGGVVAAEFAHIFSAFGTRVTVLQRSQRLLRRADETIAELFTQLCAARVNVRLRQTVIALAASDRGTVFVESTDPDGIHYDFEADQVLIATGRVSNADTLDLAAAGVEQDDLGRVVVDRQQRTTAAGIFALGGVCDPASPRHVAAQEARVVAHNLLHPDSMIAADHRFVPSAVFGDPQVASVGLTEAEARDSGRSYVVAEQPYGSVTQGWAMADTDHLVKLLADPATGQLLGAHLIGPQAAVLLQPLVQAMSFGLDARATAHGQHWVHPALSEVVRDALLALPLP